MLIKMPDNNTCGLILVQTVGKANTAPGQQAQQQNL
jgi:hypothetical protein